MLQAAAALANGGTAPQTFSSTYTLEPNVDEFDTVKYDGQTLFVQTGNAQAAILADRLQSNSSLSSLGLLPGPVSGTSAIRVLSTQAHADTAPTVAEVARISFDPSLQIMGMYLSNNRLTALSSTSYFGVYGLQWANLNNWGGGIAHLSLHDVTQAASPRLTHSVDIEGGYVQSRRIADTVYVVTRHTPNLALPFGGSAVKSDGKTPSDEFANMVAQLKVADVVPKLTIDGVSQPLFEAKNCFIQNPQDASAINPYPVISSITAVNLNDPRQSTSVCYLGDAYGIYMAASALYITQSRYKATQDLVSVSDSTADSRVHKFGLAGQSITYKGSADVPGTVWSSGQGEFRMSEFAGALRMLTTSFSGDPANRFVHQLLVLRESANAQALELVATLPNSAHPQSIGKPNEDLLAVRFFGDRAYAVTFQRKDPLYVFDLSDPAAPYIRGSLDLAGYSSFLHPVSRDLLLGIGQDEQNRLKLELFRVSDNMAPVSRGAVTLGGPWSYSEALYNRTAVSYLASDTGADRFAIAATLTADGNFSQSGQYQFEVRGKGTPDTATLVQVGTLITATPESQTPWWSGYGARSVIQGAATFFVDQAGVWSGLWGSAKSRTGPI
ncbi:MAG: beta-propeller domain-containing protein [Betaproteobacteria bacterium]